ncbi:MAG TPA: DUF4445 domain-containing protein [Clostridiaceae bacterium]|nr:DUF4445 domain-containing protein [Clostridiaceae bacterium]
MKYNIKIHVGENVTIEEAQSGENLLDFIRRTCGNIETPCNGKGTCGKCRVKVSGLDTIPSEREKKLLGTEALANGYRLACYNTINSDLDIYCAVDKESGKAKILTESKQRDIALNPVITKKFMQLNPPALHDQAPDMERVAACSDSKVVNSIQFLRELPNALRQENFKTTFVYFDGELVSVEPGDTTRKIYGVAVDIGTTTVAGYLYDLNTGKRLDVYSILNPQGKFGADVLSRIDHTTKSEEGQKEINDAIIKCINEMIGHFAEKNNIKKTDIYAVVLAGNTTMMHFFLNLSAKNIAVSPFIPVTTYLSRFLAREVGININSSGYVVTLPCISGYVGADTVAAVLSSGMYESGKISLLLDIGTNGEIVLGSSKWMYCCSTAAGPAFEGANIRNGIGGVAGAIDRVYFKPEFRFTTIDNAKAVGICGSGLVDVVAGMLDSEIIDETGRIVTDDEAESLPEGLRERIKDIDGLRAFVLSKGNENASGMDIAITQKDVRELQNAKAAIAAGIKILIKHAGIKVEDIDKVYLAGGFGNYISIESAVKIGLIPKALKDKVESIGNAAGAGAVEGLLSRDMLMMTEEIKNRMKYIELSAIPEFVNEYVECMIFE